MSTHQETVEFILGKLGDDKAFASRAMFGEYALYAHGKVVGLICNDTLYVKILPQTKELEAVCEKGKPYPGAKPHYVVAEEQLGSIENLPAILLDIAKALPAKEKKTAEKK